MPSVLVAVCALIGLLVGSFLNVVIARVPAGESVLRPASRCPSCGTPIAPRDNVPVVSWLLLRGRARCCGARISPRYPLVELGTAAFFALVALWAQGSFAPGPDPATTTSTALTPAAWDGSLWPLPAFLYLAAASVALAVIDLQTLRLPFWIVVPSWWAGAVLLGGAALLMGHGDAAVRMLAGGVGYWALYRLVFALSGGKLGYGDVRLAGLLGGYLAWVGWGTLVAGVYAGTLVAGVAFSGLLLARRAGLKSELPYGPPMIVGAWLGLFWGQQVVGAVLGV
ncbi:MAG TPA: prepilin peptidase [Kineosporiaceae bacterium]|nr:prepilin peptidase [Kineosporiaceae bacterium]